MSTNPFVTKQQIVDQIDRLEDVTTDWLELIAQKLDRLTSRLAPVPAAEPVPQYKYSFTYGTTAAPSIDFSNLGEQTPAPLPKGTPAHRAAKLMLDIRIKRDAGDLTLTETEYQTLLQHVLACLDWCKGCGPSVDFKSESPAPKKITGSAIGKTHIHNWECKHDENHTNVFDCLYGPGGTFSKSQDWSQCHVCNPNDAPGHLCSAHTPKSSFVGSPASAVENWFSCHICNPNGTNYSYCERHYKSIVLSAKKISASLERELYEMPLDELKKAADKELSKKEISADDLFKFFGDLTPSDPARVRFPALSELGVHTLAKYINNFFNGEENK